MVLLKLVQLQELMVVLTEVKATNLEGLTGKVALTYTFGRSGNSF